MKAQCTIIKIKRRAWQEHPSPGESVNAELAWVLGVPVSLPRWQLRHVEQSYLTQTSQTHHLELKQPNAAWPYVSL